MTSRSTILPKTLGQAEFQAIADHCYAVASKAVRNNESVLSVLLLGRIQDGKPQILEAGIAPVSGPDTTVILAALTQALVQNPELDFVVHITEAWLLVNPPALPTKSIADHPQKQEAVTFNILSKDCQLVVINYLRRNPSRLERGKVDFSMKIGGRMVRDNPPVN